MRTGITLAAMAGTLTSEASPLSPTASTSMHAKMPLFPDDAQFWYETVRAFGASSFGGSEFGEVLATTARIKSGDYDSWYEAYNSIAENVEKEAADQLSRARTRSGTGASGPSALNASFAGLE